MEPVCRPLISIRALVSTEPMEPTVKMVTISFTMNTRFYEGTLLIFKLHEMMTMCADACAVTDNCLSSPCKNKASCVNGINQYACVCPPMYTGKNCGQR